MRTALARLCVLRVGSGPGAGNGNGYSIRGHLMRGADKVPGAHRRKRFLNLKWGELSQPTGWPEIAALLRTHFKFMGSLIARSKPCGFYVGPLCARSGHCQPAQGYLVLIASLAAKHKNKPPVALSITRTTRLFFSTADAKCVDKMRVTDHIVPIATWMLTRIKVHIKGE